MEAIFAIVTVVVAFIGLDIAATIWGVDSRETMLDDRR
jgi:hypothetical protein